MADVPSDGQQKRWAWLRELRPLFITLGLVIFAETAIAQPFIVPSGSMEPTLLVGDEIVASKFAYGYSRYSLPFGPTRDIPGEIAAVFRLPRDTSETYVKRVIGLPGDRIQLKAGILYINGEAAPRRQIGTFIAQIGYHLGMHARYIETLPNGREHEIIKNSDHGGVNDTPEYAVPPGNYFMMGDNRDNSSDSRISPESGGVGFVPAENIVGRADRVLFSITPFGQWVEAIRHPLQLRISRLLKAVG
jgi:signal peptidase I